MRRSFKPGNRFRVCIGSGLDSRREGVVQPSGKYSYAQLKKDNPGLYKPTDYTCEVVLLDDNGKLFTMFKDRLIAI